MYSPLGGLRDILTRDGRKSRPGTNEKVEAMKFNQKSNRVTGNRSATGHDACRWLPADGSQHQAVNKKLIKFVIDRGATK
jgi:hypothetical protein